MLIDEGDGHKAMHLLIGCDDVKLLRRAVVPQFLRAADSQRERADFGGVIKVVILDEMTPDGPELREAVSFLNDRLRGIAVETHMKTKAGNGLVGPN
jgi:hypothetical protein